ncbi:DJ-1/PfpI family protein [Sulfurovum sp. zt1-1]|uniref:DJ-1/PfpI family protein n=1 Tax=Sulfurovum zhangzhouensis TaxID=3019067 RepID=A0ABT7QZ93_9BACT|nr:DJ-1 family glyoxalase III [Sulfurovum zhangzhouensis]MDM5272138.1 DJ-1/PfpI family protein [Sulfurovum zhangzhouensis]
MARVLLPLAKGFEELEAVALIDVMRRGGIEVSVAYVGEESAVLGAHGIRVVADLPISEANSDDFDMIVLPGGWGGTHALAEDAKVISLVQELKTTKAVGAMCAAPYVLKKAGVLGKSYTCYPGVEDEIDHPGYREDTKVVIDDNVLTSKGPGTAVCFGLAIIERLEGAQTMQTVKKGMLLDYC